MRRPVALLNSAVMPWPGNYDVTEVDAPTLAAEARERGVASYIRHSGTALVLAEIVGRGVEVNNYRYQPLPGDVAVALQLDIFRGRVKFELSPDEVRAHGYRLLRIERLK